MSNHEETLVLVADDEPSTLALVTAHLKSKAGFKIVEASDGDMAWQLAHEHLPDLVILDVMMPGMSGWEVCRKIRESLPLAHTGVIMLTGIGENLNEMTSPLYGADAHVDKPFEFADLDEKIEKTLKSRREGAFGRADHADEISADEGDEEALPAVTQPSPPLSKDEGAKVKPVRVKGKPKAADEDAAEPSPPAGKKSKAKTPSGQLGLGLADEAPESGTVASSRPAKRAASKPAAAAPPKPAVAKSKSSKPAAGKKGADKPAAAPAGGKVTKKASKAVPVKVAAPATASASKKASKKPATKKASKQAAPKKAATPAATKASAKKTAKKAAKKTTVKKPVAAKAPQKKAASKAPAKKAGAVAGKQPAASKKGAAKKGASKKAAKKR